MGVKSGKVLLILADEGTSAASIKSVRDMCEYYDTPMLMVSPKETLSMASGRANTKFVGVTDNGFAKKLSEIICENTVQRCND